MAIDPQMEKVVNYLVDTQQEIADALKADQDRPWVNFESLKKAGKFDFDSVHEIFTRDDANNEYAKLKQQKETKSKDIMTAKLSADFLSGCERDYRMRTRSRVRTLVHGGIVSATAYSDSRGPLRRNTIDWLSRILSETAQD